VRSIIEDSSVTALSSVPLTNDSHPGQLASPKNTTGTGEATATVTQYTLTKAIKESLENMLNKIS